MTFTVRDTEHQVCSTLPAVTESFSSVLIMTDRKQSFTIACTWNDQFLQLRRELIRHQLADTP